MFTGLIETVGSIATVRSHGNYRTLAIQSDLDLNDIAIGESIACDGACLTVTEIRSDAFVVQASQETIKRTVLDDYRVGRAVNLERALAVGSRLGGHFVTGHVDDTGVVDYLRPVGESFELAVKHDPAYDRLVIDKGSITINGVSLTVNACRTGRFSVNLIPHTIRNANLSELRTNSKVNLEFDLIGKYVSKAIGSDEKQGITLQKLMENGW